MAALTFLVSGYFFLTGRALEPNERFTKSPGAILDAAGARRVAGRTPAIKSSHPDQSMTLADRPSSESTGPSSFSKFVFYMKSLGMRPIFVLSFLFCGQFVFAADFGGYVALTTDYVKRGVTQSDGDPALQLGVDLSLENGFFLGAWGSTVDISNGPATQRDLEVNYYAGYVFDASDSWRLSAGAVAYVYPGQTGNFDYDYQEYSVGASFDDRVWLEVAYSPDLYNSGHSTANIDLYAEWPISSVWAIGGGAGHYDTSNFSGSSYQYWQLGITASLTWAAIDLRVHDTDKWVPVVSRPDRAKSRLVLKIQIPF